MSGSNRPSPPYEREPLPAEAERWSREHDSNVRALACDLRFKGGSVRPLPHPGKMEPRIGFEPMSSCLKGEHPGPLDERGAMERAARLELALSAWKADAQPICQAREVAESAAAILWSGPVRRCLLMFQLTLILQALVAIFVFPCSV